MSLEIAIVLLLNLINGILALSELAIISARPPRLRVMAERGSRGAALALRLAEEPGRVLSSAQLGITLVGIIAGAFSGATLGERLAKVLVDTGISENIANPLGMGTVIVAITYSSLVLGELVPKQIALRKPEAVAVRMAGLVRVISILTAPLVWILDTSGHVVLALLGQSGASSSAMTDEEIKLVIAEAQHAGVMEEGESDMIAGVMRTSDRTARGLMTPRHEVEIIDISERPAAIAKIFRETRHSRLPVRDGAADDIIGVLSAYDFLEQRAREDAMDLRSLILSAPVVRDGMAALDVLETLRGSPAHMVLVYDEYGQFEGIVTPMDVLEAIAGDFIDAEDPDERKVVMRDDGSLLVSGWMPADEFSEETGITLPEGRDYETVAGLVLDTLGHLPEVGEKLVLQGWTLEILDLDGRRIDKILASKAD